MKSLTIIGKLQGIVLMAISFFVPAGMMVLSAITVTTIDTYLGIKKSKKISRRITSRRFRMGYFPKLIKYTVAILVTFLLDKTFISDLIGSSVDHLATKLVTCVIVMAEIKSWDENWKIIYGYSFLAKAEALLSKFNKIKQEVTE